jgi:hypothetical protein
MPLKLEFGIYLGLGNSVGKIRPMNLMGNSRSIINVNILKGALHSVVQ